MTPAHGMDSLDSSPESLFTAQHKNETWARRASWGTGIVGGASLAAVAGRAIQKWYDNYRINWLKQTVVRRDISPDKKTAHHKELSDRIGTKKKKSPTLDRVTGVFWKNRSRQPTALACFIFKFAWATV